MTIALLVCVLSTIFQVELESDDQLSTNCVCRSVGECDGKVVGIRLGTCVVGAADWEDGGRMDGTVLGKAFLGIFVGDQGGVDRCMPIGMVGF